MTAPGVRDVPPRVSVGPVRLTRPAGHAKPQADMVDTYPLTAAQTAILHGCAPRDTDVAGYRARSAPFASGGMLAAVAATVARHDVLRTSIELAGRAEPWQRVHAAAGVPLAVHDHRGLDAAARTERLTALVEAERGRPFDVRIAPLFRLTVVTEPDDAWVLLASCHRVLAEAVSLDALAAELLDGHRRWLAGDRGAELGGDNLVIRHAPCVAAELEACSCAAPVRSLPAQAVPFGLPVPWGRDCPGGRAEATAEFADLERGLAALAAASAVPLPAVLLAAHLKVLAMLSAGPGLSAEVLTGDVAAACAEPLHAVIRLVPVPSGITTWRDLVARIGRDDPAQGDGPRLPRPVPPPGPARFTRAIFDARDRHGPAARHVAETVVPGLHFADRGLWVTPAGGQLRVCVAGVADPAAQAERLAAMHRAVLTAMAADPDGDALAACLPEQERAAVLTTWSTGTRADCGTASVVDLIEAQSAATPGAVAVRAADGILTYAELARRSHQVGHYLAGLGACADSLIGVCLRRSADLVPALLGVWMAGAGYLPLDPDLPTGRLRHMLTEAGCPLVVTTAEHLPLIGPLFRGRIVLLDDEQAAIAAQPAGPTGVRVGETQLAYAIYTSGSTGAPKGVLIQHAGLVNYLSWTVGAYASWGLGGAPVFSSISFDLGIPNLFTPLLTGQATHLLPDPVEVADLGRLLAAGGPYSFIKLTPGQLDLLTHQLTPGHIRDLAGIVIAAGDAFPAALAGQWLDLAGPGGTRVGSEYGPTEITIGNSGQPVGPGPGAELVPLGPPIPNTSMYVLTDSLEPVPVGVPGEIYIGGVGVARGYLGRPDLTAERFVPDPYGPPGSRLYRSGDRARWHPDGSLHFLGRVDSQVKIRGYRVEPAEIEASLREHPDIRDAVVIASGTGPHTRLVAHVATAAGQRTDAAELRRHLAAAVPDYMIPAAFLPIDRIPLTPNGKVDVRVLLERSTTVRPE